MSVDHVALAEQYALDVVSGRVVACEYVVQACARQLRDLVCPELAKKYRFDRRLAGRVCRFIEKLKHVKGRWAGSFIVLEPWQCFNLTVVFGWVRVQTPEEEEAQVPLRRRFRVAYEEVPRKNAKSTKASGVALYCLTADGEEGAEVYSAATTRDQAKIVWEAAKAMVLRSSDFQREMGVSAGAHSIYQLRTGSSFKALSRDQQGNLDGYNIHAAIIDELHAHRDRATWDVIDTGTGARSQSLIWAVTTAGSNRAGICYEQRSYAIKVLSGVAVDEEFFAIIYTIDKGDDWRDPKIWAKANPNWGVSVDPDDIARKARKAMEMASAQNNFLTKHLNVWVNAGVAWMSMPKLQECRDPSLSEADFENDECISASDLATRTDIAATARVYRRMLDTPVKDPRTGEIRCDNLAHYYVFMSYYLPEEAVEDGRNGEYSGWAETGHLTVTPGEVTDFSYIEDDIKETAGRGGLIEAAFDPWQAAQMMQRLSNENLAVVEYRQTVQNMSAPMKELEALVLSRRLHYGLDPVLEWMFSNVVSHIDRKENVYPRKEHKKNKIDGVVAVIMALGRWIAREEEEAGFVNLNK